MSARSLIPSSTIFRWCISGMLASAERTACCVGASGRRAAAAFPGSSSRESLTSRNVNGRNEILFDRERDHWRRRTVPDRRAVRDRIGRARAEDGGVHRRRVQGDQASLHLQGLLRQGEPHVAEELSRAGRGGGLANSGQDSAASW